MSKVLKNISLMQKNEVFQTIIGVYDYTNDLINYVERNGDSGKKNFYISILNDLIYIIDKSAREISTEYSDVIKKEKVSKASSNRIKNALGDIFDAVDNAKQILLNNSFVK